MAINDMKGTVTTTGIINNKPAPMRAPDMSKIKMQLQENLHQLNKLLNL